MITVVVIALIVTLVVKFGPRLTISKDQALATLVSEIVEPSAEHENISAFMLSRALTAIPSKIVQAPHKALTTRSLIKLIFYWSCFTS